MFVAHHLIYEYHIVRILHSEFDIEEPTTHDFEFERERGTTDELLEETQLLFGLNLAQGTTCRTEHGGACAAGRRHKHTRGHGHTHGS